MPCPKNWPVDICWLKPQEFKVDVSELPNNASCTKDFSYCHLPGGKGSGMENEVNVLQNKLKGKVRK